MKIKQAKLDNVCNTSYSKNGFKQIVSILLFLFAAFRFKYAQ